LLLVAKELFGGAIARADMLFGKCRAVSDPHRLRFPATPRHTFSTGAQSMKLKVKVKNPAYERKRRSYEGAGTRNTSLLAAGGGRSP